MTGVEQIVRYNAHYYSAAIGTVASVAVLLRLRFLPPVPQMMLACSAGLVLFWTVASLLVSYYVYDYSGVTRWDWVPGALSNAPRSWLTLHTGLDTATGPLSRMFGGCYAAVDIYRRDEMTEQSIARARVAQKTKCAAIRAALDALPFRDGAQDTVFLLFAAHEIRVGPRRRALFREACRTLSPSGQVLLVEHLRDWRSFLAFGPGCFHFYSRREWLRTADAAGLCVEREAAITPFVRCFVLRHAGAV